MQNFSDNAPMDKLCRTCLRMPDVLVPLFENEKLCFKIKAISDVEVSNTNYIPVSLVFEQLEGFEAGVCDMRVVSGQKLPRNN